MTTSNTSLIIQTCFYLISGVVFGFNVKVPREVQSLADQLGIPVKLHKIIYKLFEDLKVQRTSIIIPQMRLSKRVMGEGLRSAAGILESLTKSHF